MDNLELVVALALIGGSAALILYSILSKVNEKSVVRESLRQLDGYEVESVRDQELLAPISQRALRPVFHGLTGLGRRFTPVGYVDQVRQKFIWAGNPSADAVDRFLAVRVITVVVAVIVLPVLWFVNPIGAEGLMKVILVGLIGAILLAGPDAMLSRRVAERQHELRTTLPDILDLLTISVEAGLGFEQAVDRTIDAVPGPLAEEFSRMLGEVRAGSSRSDAMRAMEQRCNVAEVRSFVLAIIQADAFGVSIGRVLRAQSEEMRVKRRQLAQETAQKAPVKMMIPMVFCIFPALFVVVLGPAIINIRESF